MPRIHPC